MPYYKLSQARSVTVIWAKQNLMIRPANWNVMLATEVDIYSQLSRCSNQILNNTALVWNKYDNK